MRGKKNQKVTPRNACAYVGLVNPSNHSIYSNLIQPIEDFCDFSLTTTTKPCLEVVVL